MMSGIRGKNTRPELLIRHGLHKRGFRYLIHDKRLPGKPDMVFPKYRAVILVHGCFWHGHGCHLFRWPSSRQEFWRDKISQTIGRDNIEMNLLHQKGWRVLVIWECILKGKKRLPIDEVIDRAASWLVGEDQYGTLAGDRNDS